MKTSNLLLLASCIVLMLIYSVNNFKLVADQNYNTINAILGDESYISTFGVAPNSSVPDEIRIDTHLKYVENLLRNSLSDGLAQHQIERRLSFLDHLRDYRMAGEFPVNDDHPDTRRPTFISDNGNICAVGYLVEQSAGREVAEFINDHYKYSYISDIDAAIFLDWAKESGFLLEELAMIQPTYQSITEVRQNNNRLEAPYIVTSSVAMTANALYWSPDITSFTPFPNNTARQWTGLAIGAGTILYGALNVNTTSTREVHDEDFFWSRTTKFIETNHLKTGLSTGQIMVGAATFLRSAFHLMNTSSQSGPNQSGLMLTSFALPHENGTQTISGIGYRLAIN